MFLKKKDLINLAMDTGVIVASGVLLKHCVEVNNKWTIQAEFKETKNDKGETVYIKIPETGKMVDKTTLEQISTFKSVANTVGKLVAIYGLFVGGIKFGSDVLSAMDNNRNDVKFDGYWNKYLEIIKNDSLNLTQKEEAVSCLRNQYGYVNIFENYDKSCEILINAAVKSAIMEDKESYNKITSMLSSLQEGKKEMRKEYVEKPESKENVAQIVSTFSTEEVKKEIPKQNMDTALENQKPAVYDEF